MTFKDEYAESLKRQTREMCVLLDYALFWGPRTCEIARWLSPCCRSADYYIEQRNYYAGDVYTCGECHLEFYAGDLLYERLPKEELDGRDEYNYPGVPATKAWADPKENDDADL